MKKGILSIALASVMTISLVACGSSNTGSTSNNSDGTVASQTAEGASDHSTLNIGFNSAPQNISPFTNFTNRGMVAQYLYEPLMIHDTDGNWLPVIAKSYTTDDNINYDFEIFDYVKDSAGNEIKAEDCVFSLEHARDEAANTWIASAEVTGDYTFRLTVTDDAVSTFPTAVDRAPIVSKAAYEADPDGMATTVISTSPYKVSEFVSNVSISFVKNENYWQTDEQYLAPLAKDMSIENMNFTKIAEAAQQTIALETGTVDAFYGISTTEVKNFLDDGRDASNFTAIGDPSNTAYCFYFGNGGLAVDDENLRKAILYAIDKEAINIGAFDGLSTVPTWYGAPDGLSDLTPSEINPDFFNYDIEKAKDYLSKSNYNGEELRFLVPNEDNHNRIAAIVQGQLMAAGINAKIESYDNAMFQTNFGDGSTFDIAVCQMGLSDIAFVWKFMSWDLSGGENGALGTGLSIPEFDEILKKANTIETHNAETATEVNNYIIEHGLGEVLIVGKSYSVFKKSLGAKSVPYYTAGYSERSIGATVFE